MDQVINGISVIVCCYNSENRLPKTLKHLATQNLTDTVNCELILVNNNSTDKTKEVALKLWKQFDSSIKLNIVDEPKPGLSFARAAGINAAKYDILVFCDDDNWLDKNYLNIVSKRFHEDPKIGALGGWCDPSFEEEEPEWFQTFQANFAVGKTLKKSGYLSLPHEYIYGAGMVISKKAMNTLYANGFYNILSDRKGKQLSSGGDVEMIYALKLLNIPVYFDDALHFYHFMPNDRMTWQYLLKIRKSMQWSNFVLNIYIDAQNKTTYSALALVRKYLKSIKKIQKLKKKLKSASKYESLFIENKIVIQKLFLTNPFFYFSTRKKLSNLQDA